MARVLLHPNTALYMHALNIRRFPAKYVRRRYGLGSSNDDEENVTSTVCFIFLLKRKNYMYTSVLTVG